MSQKLIVRLAQVSDQILPKLHSPIRKICLIPNRSGVSDPATFAAYSSRDLTHGDNTHDGTQKRKGLPNDEVPRLNEIWPRSGISHYHIRTTHPRPPLLQFLVCDQQLMV